MSWVTDLGDPAATVAAAAVLFGSLLHGASRGTALSWAMAVAACGAVTATGKLAIYAYGQPIPAIWLGSPSGHAAAGVLVYGGLALAAAGAARRVLSALLPVLLAVALAGLIAASRVYLGVHSISDVLVGSAIGAACLAWFAARRGVSSIRTGVLACLAVCLAVPVLQIRLPVDPLLRAAAASLVAGWQAGDGGR